MTERPLLFDAHNHVHLSVPGGIPSSWESDDAVRDHAHTILRSLGPHPVGGVALMSTRSRDFEAVRSLACRLSAGDDGILSVRCYGVHPWFLHLEETHEETPEGRPAWLPRLRERLRAEPDAHVGEIGLDGARYDPATDSLVSSMERQTEAFVAQMELAAQWDRTVSIHAVRCWGELFAALRRLAPTASKKERRRSEAGGGAARRRTLPPRLYFHAFGGKAAVVDQLDAMCGRGKAELFFGFAPAVNFRAPKTADVVRKVGLRRIVLETDREDPTRVGEDLEQGCAFLAEAFEMEREAVMRITEENALRLYGLEAPSRED